MKILTIDDHALFRQGLKFLLKGFDSSVEVVEASTLAETLSLPDKESVEFILLDYHLPDSKGIASLTRIAPIYENAVIVILSGEEDPNLIKEAIDRGAAGFIPKSSTQDILIAALKLILAGGVYVPNLALQSNAAANPAAAKSHTLKEKANSLSKRQRDVLIRAVQGKPNKMIARELCIAEGTVKAHLSAAFSILEVSNRTEAVYVASKLELIQI